MFAQMLQTMRMTYIQKDREVPENLFDLNNIVF